MIKSGIVLSACFRALSFSRSSFSALRFAARACASRLFCNTRTEYACMHSTCTSCFGRSGTNLARHCLQRGGLAGLRVRVTDATVASRQTLTASSTRIRDRFAHSPQQCGMSRRDRASKGAVSSVLLAHVLHERGADVANELVSSRWRCVQVLARCDLACGQNRPLGTFWR